MIYILVYANFVSLSIVYFNLIYNKSLKLFKDFFRFYRYLFNKESRATILLFFFKSNNYIINLNRKDLFIVYLKEN